MHWGPAITGRLFFKFLRKEKKTSFFPCSWGVFGALPNFIFSPVNFGRGADVLFFFRAYMCDTAKKLTQEDRISIHMVNSVLLLYWQSKSKEKSAILSFYAYRTPDNPKEEKFSH